MSIATETTATCNACGHVQKVKVFGSINVAEDFGLKSKVKDGSLFAWQCPQCGRWNLLKYMTLYHDPESRLMVWLVPEGAMDMEQEALVEKKMTYLTEEGEDGKSSLEGYVLRKVGEVGDLIEKVNIHDAGLDDVVIEMCKYFAKMELGEKLSEEDRNKLYEAPFKFYRMEGPDNDLTFSYPMDGQMQGAQIGFKVYEDCSGIVSRNPKVVPHGGFVVVDASWIAKFFK
jgi:hypothetical protein